MIPPIARQRETESISMILPLNLACFTIKETRSYDGMLKK